MLLEPLREELDRGGIQTSEDPVTYQEFTSFLVDDRVLARVIVYSPRTKPHIVYVKTNHTSPFEFDLTDPASIDKIIFKILELQREWQRSTNPVPRT